jgi:hypothetical protein
MKLLESIALAVIVAMAGGCNTPGPLGTSYATVEIASSPTPAMIHVDGAYMGRTPLHCVLSFSNRTRFITVTATPIYPAQAEQKIRLRVPPLPERIQFFMNNPDVEDAATSDRQDRG